MLCNDIAVLLKKLAIFDAVAALSVLQGLILPEELIVSPLLVFLILVIVASTTTNPAEAYAARHKNLAEPSIRCLLQEHGETLESLSLPDYI